MRVLVVVACLASSLSAQAEDVRVAGRARARREAIAAGTLGALSFALLAVGGILAGVHSNDASWRTGLGFVGVGAGLVFPATLTGAYAGGHASALDGVTLPAAPDEATRRRLLLEVDLAARHARKQRIAGIVLTLVGAALTASGAALVLRNVPVPCSTVDDPGPCPSTSGGALIAGSVISSVGNAALLTGMHLWSHAAGAERGLADTRQALMLTLTPSGLAARF